MLCLTLCVHKTRWTPQRINEVLVPSHDNERSCIYVLGTSIFPLFLDLENVLLTLNIFLLSCNYKKNGSDTSYEDFSVNGLTVWYIFFVSFFIARVIYDNKSKQFYFRHSQNYVFQIIPIYTKLHYFICDNFQIYVK